MSELFKERVDTLEVMGRDIQRLRWLCSHYAVNLEVFSEKLAEIEGQRDIQKKRVEELGALNARTALVCKHNRKSHVYHIVTASEEYEGIRVRIITMCGFYSDAKPKSAFHCIDLNRPPFQICDYCARGQMHPANISELGPWEGVA